MNKNYIIQWKSKSNGRAGKGSKLFDRETAERLVRELNHDYPQIEHEAVSARSSQAPELSPVGDEKDQWAAAA